MVNCRDRSLFLVILLLFCIHSSQCQEIIPIDKSNSVKDVGRFSFLLESQLLSPAALSNQIGYKSFDNKYIWNGAVGVGIEVQRSRRNEIFALFFTNFEPLFRLSFQVKEDELPPGFYEILPRTISGYTMNSYSLGLYDRFNVMSVNSISYSIIAGLNVKYFPYGDGDLGIGLSPTNQSQIMDVFKLSYESSRRSIQGSCQIGAGIGFAIWKGYLNIELLRNFNFNDSITGEYIWWNLADNGISSGNYKLKGDYTSLKLSIRKFSILKK